MTLLHEGRAKVPLFWTKCTWTTQRGEEVKNKRVSIPVRFLYPEPRHGAAVLLPGSRQNSTGAKIRHVAIGSLRGREKRWTRQFPPSKSVKFQRQPPPSSKQSSTTTRSTTSEASSGGEKKTVTVDEEKLTPPKNSKVKKKRLPIQKRLQMAPPPK